MLRLDLLVPHPRNPRLAPREDVIQAIRVGLAQGFDPAHALIVRPYDGRWQILSGHQRAEAARRAGLSDAPCWVRDLNDDAAYMLLATSNAQGELSALERGTHALNCGLDVRAYAKSIGRKRTTVNDEVSAAEVAQAVPDIRHDLLPYYSQLVVIHTTRPWVWPALAREMLRRRLTVGATRPVVARLKDLPAEMPKWVNAGFCEGLVVGAVTPKDLQSIEDLCASTAAELQDLERQQAPASGDDTVAATSGDTDPEPQIPVDGVSFSTYSDALAYCNTLTEMARQRLAELRRAGANEQQKNDEARQRSAKYLEHVSREEWDTLDDAAKQALLLPDPARVTVSQFDKNVYTPIEWATHSWDPITGCVYICPYCSAREIATSKRKVKGYPYAFALTLRPSALLAPSMTPVPLDGVCDPRERIVVTGWMTDIFAPDVPGEWIEAVLLAIRNAPNWNFLCLTKFPERMAEFDIPENMWMGATVDRQDRVTLAEEAFTKISSKVKWLACEPLLEPLQFAHLERFHWIVIGGANPNKQSTTPEWRPPFRWIADIVEQARDAGVAVYQQSNLLGNRIRELPFDAPTEAGPFEVPEVLQYVKPL
jgi:protein gp37/ParB-like chromosome segregation protein Spo0J